MKYPAHWPGPTPKRPQDLASRITEAQKEALYNRRITTKALAKELGCSMQHLSSRFPGKIPGIDRSAKTVLVLARKEYKIELGKEILQGKYTIAQAAVQACVSYNTMQRYLQKSKERYPELAKRFERGIKSKDASNE